MKLGMGEILVVLLIALFVLGPDQLPSYARKLGNALKAFRNAASETTEDIRENIIEPLNEAQQPLRKALEPVEEMQKEIDQSVKDVKKSLKEVSAPITSNKTGTDKGPDTETTDVSDKISSIPERSPDHNGENEPGQQPESENTL